MDIKYIAIYLAIPLLVVALVIGVTYVATGEMAATKHYWNLVA